MESITENMLIARPYQVELVEKAIERNVIIYLPTGSGKTFIAVMLIQHFSKNAEETQIPYSEGGKIIVFLANTVPLILQQAFFLKKHTHMDVGDYYGEKMIEDKIIDFWDKTIWEKEFDKNKILVIIPKIFVTLINHSFIDINRIKLLFFDECHHATGNHPYSQIMTSYHEKEDASKNIRIVGLTASVVKAKCDLAKFNANKKKLEDTFKCKIETSSMLVKNKNKPKIMMIYYNAPILTNLKIFSLLAEFNDLLVYLNNKLKNFQSEQNNWISNKIDSQFASIKKETQDLEYVFEELGVWSFCCALPSSMYAIKKYLNNTKKQVATKTQEIFEIFQTKINIEMRKILSEKDEQNVEKILENSSDKVNCLIELFCHHYSRSKFHSIVFVDRRSAASYLNRLLNKISELKSFHFIRSDVIFGLNKSSRQDQMNFEKQESIVNSFRSNDINVLVATNIVEEGVDISTCNMIFRFSHISNFGSYIQSKGRARSNDSIYFIFADELKSNKNNAEICNYLNIEEIIETQLMKNDELDQDSDSFMSIHNQISSYRKGMSEITCNTAIELVTRYCATLQHDIVLYPLFKNISHQMNGKKSYSCSIRLPPNSVINKAIESDIFARKKWSKMHAALLMCIELDKAGELSDNLTILTKEQWISTHYEIKEDIEESSKSVNKIGSVKNKREYEATIADEFNNSHPEIEQQVYLYHIRIIESKLSEKELFTKTINTNINIGFLSTKKMDVPEFNLHKSNSQYKISLININLKCPLIIDKTEYTLLLQMNRYIYNEILGYNYNYSDWEENLNIKTGGFLVFLKKNTCELDWTLMQSFNCNKVNLLELMQKKNFHESKIKNKIVRTMSNMKLIMRIVRIDRKLTASSQFPKEGCSDFSDYFFDKYGLETTDKTQPLAELEHMSLSKNFLRKTVLFKTAISKPKYQEFYICEHLLLLPFDKDQLFVLYMLPAIFFRTNCLLKAQKLHILLENQILKSLEIKKRPVKDIWESSIKFHKKTFVDSNETTDDILYNDEENMIPLNCMSRAPMQQQQQHSKLKFLDDDDANAIPKLIINDDDQFANKEFDFPNVYHILQCLTLKSANDDFDLERYEILGDCFLKLTVVMKIYADPEFVRTSEGKIADLKSQRVSNRYLFRLASNKHLQKYIVSENFDTARYLFQSCFGVFNQKYCVSLSDKSIADCVEALIGCYLIKVGSHAAKCVIEWLEFVISNKLGRVKFCKPMQLPDPLLNKCDQSFINRLKLQYRQLESHLNYSFKNIIYLYQAFTHPSDVFNNKYTSSYQKLELVGDAVLDILITQYVFGEMPECSPGELTNLRASLVNNRFFAHLAVKHSFHKHLNHGSPDLLNILAEYVDFHEKFPPDEVYLQIKKKSLIDNQNELYFKKSHTINDQIHLQTAFDNGDKYANIEHDVEPPKFLADIFEAVAGAIYLDSDCSLKAVWEVFYKIFKPYLIVFKKNIPMSPIVALKKLKPHAYFNVEFNELPEEKKIECVLHVDSDIFKATGVNKIQAKVKVFKQAVKTFDLSKSIIFF